MRSHFVPQVTFLWLVVYRISMNGGMKGGGRTQSWRKAGIDWQKKGRWKD